MRSIWPVSYTHLDVYKRQVITLADEFDVPVKFIGVGEGMEDLQVFDPEMFAGALFEK